MCDFYTLQTDKPIPESSEDMCKCGHKRKAHPNNLECVIVYKDYRCLKFENVKENKQPRKVLDILNETD